MQPRKSIPRLRITAINKILQQSNNNPLTEVLAEAGLLESAEGRRDVGLVVGVDEHGARVEEVCHVHRLVDVTREDARSESVLGAVGAAQDSVDVAAGEKQSCTHFELIRSKRIEKSSGHPFPNLLMTITGPNDSS